MVVWQIKGDKVEPIEQPYFARKSAAQARLRQYRNKHGRKAGSGPDKVDIRGRDQLVAALNAACSSEENENPFL
jgi:hypothetical protein